MQPVAPALTYKCLTHHLFSTSSKKGCGVNLRIQTGQQWKWWWRREARPYTRRTGHPERMWHQSAPGKKDKHIMGLFPFLLHVVWGHKLCSSSHPALEAEDGDRKTNQRCDSQTQQHWLGVVKAGRKWKMSWIISPSSTLNRSLFFFYG